MCSSRTECHMPYIGLAGHAACEKLMISLWRSSIWFIVFCDLSHWRPDGDGLDIVESSQTRTPANFMLPLPWLYRSMVLWPLADNCTWLGCALVAASPQFSGNETFGSPILLLYCGLEKLVILSPPTASSTPHSLCVFVPHIKLIQYEQRRSSKLVNNGTVRKATLHF